MLRLRNRFLPLLRAASPLPAAPIHPHLCRLLSTSTSASPVPFSLADHLVAACGLTPAQAREASNKAFHEVSKKSSKDELSRSRLLSASNPDAILALLAGAAGLSRADIAAVVSADPLLLRASVKNLEPRLVALLDDVGLSAPQIARLLMRAGAHVRHRTSVVPRLQFFISFYGSFDKVMLALKRNTRLFSTSIERSVKPTIALLRHWGVRDIAQLCSYVPWLLSSSPERVEEFLLRAEQLGVPPNSGLFKKAVATVVFNSKEKVAAKLVFFEKTLGCLESEVSTAVSKVPLILGLSDKILLRKIEFLVNEAAMEPCYIVERPILLTYSLEKRLVPRHYVMKILQEKGLLINNMSLYSFASLGEETFKSKFIDCHMDSVPDLADAYAAACAGILLSRV